MTHLSVHLSVTAVRGPQTEEHSPRFMTKKKKRKRKKEKKKVTMIMMTLNGR